MPASRAPSSPDDLPHWLRQPVLRLPLPDAEAQLQNLIDAGFRLVLEAIHLHYKADDATPFRRRVDEWRAQSLAWLNRNVGGQAADEYKTASTHSYKDTEKWNSYDWSAVLERDVDEETQVLVSIADRLPQWVSPRKANPDSLMRQSVGAETSKKGGRADLAFATNRKAVMVIYGHDKEANNALFAWLRAIGLQPKEWSQLIQLSGSASPYIGQVLDKALQHVQAVVALFTPDERVRPVGHSGPWRLQPRPNVLIEAGMALVTHPTRTVIVTLGRLELPSDFAGRHYIRINRTAGALNDIASRLETAGCEIDKSGTQWLDPTRFPDRDGISASPSS